MDTQRKPTSRRVYEISLITAFLAAICLPLVAQLVRWRTATTTEFVLSERRPPADFPKWKWSAPGLRKWPRKFDDWYRDHFGLRGDAIRLSSSMRLALGAPAVVGTGGGTATRTVTGDDGWFYLGDSFNDLIKLCTGRLKHSDAKLAEVVGALERRRQQIVARGIPVVLVIAPDKQSIYGEHLPSWCRPTTGKTATDQFIESFGRQSGFKVVDLRPPLREARQQYGDLLYYKTDSHWTNLGAYIAYLHIMEACKDSLPDVHPLQLSSYTTVPATIPGDILTLAGIDSLMPDHEVSLTLTEAGGQLPPVGTAVFRPGPLANTMIWRNPERSRQSRMLLVGDSFTNALLPLLSQTLGQTASASNLNTNPEEVLTWMDSFKPQVIVIEIVERQVDTVAGAWGLPEPKPANDPPTLRAAK